MAVKSKTALGTDIDTKLASASNITATEHRSLEHDIVDSYEDFIGSYTTVQIAALVGMTTRQIVYDTTIKAYYYYDGAAWQPLSGRKYKVYTALLTQGGTSAPVADVLENTLGGTVVWSRDGVGDYTATLAGAFAGKFFAVNQTIFSSATPYKGIHVFENNNDSFKIATFDLGTETNEDDIMPEPTPIEVRVYP